jgi:hypothetical protein
VPTSPAGCRAIRAACRPDFARDRPDGRSASTGSPGTASTRRAIA